MSFCGYSGNTPALHDFGFDLVGAIGNPSRQPLAAYGQRQSASKPGQSAIENCETIRHVNPDPIALNIDQRLGQS